VTARRDKVAPAWSVRISSELSSADERAVAVVTGLTPQELNWKSHAGEWSIGQCIDHLLVSNTVYCPAISKALEGQQPGRAEEITPGWFGQWFIDNYIESSGRTKPRHAPRKITPGPQVDRSVIDRFLESNERARELVERAARYDVNSIRFRNPFLPVIHFTVATGFEILSKHQRRHLLQAERMRAALS
jgi:hypothetical protein